MRRLLFVVGVVAAIGLISGPAMADTMAMATKHVFVTVAPDVAVGGLAPHIDAGEVQRGLVIVDVPFRIDANKEQVTINVAATDLWKGDVCHDGGPGTVPPIILCDDVGVLILAEFATPLGGTSNTAQVVGAGPIIDGCPSTQYGDITFESGQDGRFSQDVNVTVCWDQNEFEKPEGEYSGYVKLTAIVEAGAP